MGIFRSLMTAGATVLAAFAMKKIVKALETQSENARVKAEAARDPREFKRLKQDPATGVYYAED